MKSVINEMLLTLLLLSVTACGNAQQPDNITPENNNDMVQIDNKDTVRVDSSDTVRADGNDMVRADGNDTVRADGNDTVRADGSDTVRADGNDTVRADGNDTVRADGNDTVRADGNDAVPSGNTVMAGDVELTLQSVEVNESIGLMRRTFVATGEWEEIEELLGNALNVSETEQQDGRAIVTQTTFYKEKGEIWKFCCNVRGECAEYTFEEMATDLIENKSFTTATADGRQATVILTPYAAWIRTDSAWMDMEDAYQFAAELSDGSEQEIAILPLARSRKAREQTLKELSYLGEGYKVGEELADEDGDAVGGRFLFLKKILPDEIEAVQVYV